MNDESTHRRRLDSALEPEYLADLGSRSTDDVRARRDECSEIENEVSYVRRLAQARIEILRAELDRRKAGGSVGDLIEALPQILAGSGERVSAPRSRLPSQFTPSADIEWKRGLERLVGDDTLANLPTLPEEELRDTLEQLITFEAEISSTRRELHKVIETLEGEIAQRLKVGRA